MGLVANWFGPKKEDPLVGVAKEMISMVREQAEQNNKLMLQVLATQKDQNLTTQRLLDVYLSPQANTTTSLDERLYQKSKDDEWDPIDFMPFQEMMQND